MHAGSDEVLPAKIVQDLQGLGYDADGSKVAASDANMDLLDNKAKKTLATKVWRSLKPAQQRRPRYARTAARRQGHGIAACALPSVSS